MNADDMTHKLEIDSLRNEISNSLKNIEQTLISRIIQLENKLKVSSNLQDANIKIVQDENDLNEEIETESNEEETSISDLTSLVKKMNDISKNENQKQYDKIHEEFKDPLSDKDLIKIMIDFGKSDDDFS